jgi:type IV pilus assembly protein PilY1
MKKTVHLSITGVLILSILVMPASAAAAEPSMATYTCYPVFQVNTVEANILVILDNSGSMNFQAYIGAYDHSTEYYGYFEPYKKYSYASNVFTRNASGDWDGNFLNWLTMRRIDVARKALMGGLATSRTGGGNQVNIGETPAQNGRDFTKSYKDTDGVTPLSSSTIYNYLVDGGYFYVNSGTYTIKVQKDITYPDEADNFVDGNIAGVFQKLSTKARWGNAFFEYGTGSNESGATIDHVIGTNMTTLITDFQNTGCDTWAPLAEAYYIAMQYFKQDDEDGTLDYANGAADNANIGDDPWYNGSEYVDCAKSFVLLLTDGTSTKDAMIPAMYKDYADSFDTFLSDVDSSEACDEDTGTGCEYASGGTDYLKDVAYWARVNDLRSSSVGKSELSGDQNLILYAVYAFGNDANAEKLIKEAAKNGGFVEKDGTTGPSSQSEWDADSDGDPDTYFRADTGSNLESKILQAINAILERAASGTAVSVLATSSEGEGNLVQAYFRPVKTVGTTDIKWLGYLQSLWVDSYGYMREDTNGNQTLNIDVDKIITHYLDSSTGDTKVKRFSVSSSVPYPDTETASYEMLELDEVNAIWEAGSILAQRSASARNLFTYLDKDEDGVVDETTDNPFDALGEVVKFHTDAASDIKPYLGVRDNSEWSYLGAAYDDRVTNLIQYVRGETVSGFRERAADYDGNGSDEEWKLGDIVHSTPVTISKPPDNFHLIYSDESYQNYYNAYKDRETVVYVGANDGVLHAFTSWKYNGTTKQFSKPSGTTEAIGDELWGYIPQSLLAHLKWLPSTNYTHVYYADLKPKIFDAKILADETHYTDSDTDDNWGTFLLLGLNLGGGDINVLSDFNGDGDTSDATDDRDFAPSYALLDITEPRNPRLVWERSYGDLELTTSIPAVVKVKNKWFAVFGSGPSACECDDSTTTKNGHVFVVDLKTGDPYQNASNDWLFATSESKAFMSSPVALDKNLNYNVDAVYVGETYYSSGWKGKMYKVTIPWADRTGTYDDSDTNNYSDNPLSGTRPWTLTAFFNATRPITAPAALSVDNNDNAWVYFGTGRYLGTDDKTNTDTQYFFGVKDPFFNQNRSPSTYYHTYSGTVELTTSDLLTTDNYTVTTAKEVYDGSDTLVPNLEALVAAEDGWMRTLSTSKERVLVKPALLGGVVFVPSFVPSSDICGYGGDSYLYGLYYLTGTAYWDPIFPDETTTVSIGGVDKIKVLDKISLGSGKASSLGLHVGLGDDATGFIQQSTGTVLQKKLNPAFNVKSGLTSWIQK